MDAVAAFLNSPLDEEIYLEQPEGFEVGGKGKVWKLHKSISTFVAHRGRKALDKNWFCKDQRRFLRIFPKLFREAKHPIPTR
jgi:hypothetical protein